MLKLRQVGAQRIVKSRRVVLQGPELLTDGLVLADHPNVAPRGGTIVKIHKKTLEEIWRRKADLVLGRSAGDRLFLFHADQCQVWDASGKLLWKRQYPGGLVPWDGRLLHWTESEVQTVDPKTGDVVERSALEGSWAELVTYAVVGDVFVLGPQMSTDPLRAFDIRQRRVLWEKSVLSEIRERFRVDCRSLVLAPSGLGRFVGTSGTHAYGFSVAEGSPRWMQPLGLHYNMAPIKDERVYAWSTTGSSTTRTTIDMDRGEMTREMTVPVTSRNHFVVIDEARGDIMMDRDLAAEGAPFDQFQEPGQATFCQRHMVYATRSAWIVVFRLSDGEVVWRQQYSNQVFTPAFDDNRLYFPCADGTLVVYEAEGEEL